MSLLHQDHADMLTEVTLKRRDMCNILFQSKHKQLDGKFSELEEYVIAQTSCSRKSLSELKTVLRNFKKQFTKKWLAYSRHKERFLESERCWLDGNCLFKINRISNVGRPVVDFASSSEQSKRRKTAELRSAYSADELSYATQMKLRATGKALEAQIVKRVCESREFAKKCSESQSSITRPKISVVEALSLIVEAQLSRKQYNLIRNYTGDVFPPYKQVKKEKIKCYPNGIRITETESEVPLQPLLDHTTSRLLSVQKDCLPNHSTNNLVLLSKWGFDGSSSHTQYMQKFVSEEADDKYMFLSSLVPLRLVSKVNNEVDRENIIWQNPRPSSPRFCRPIKLQYKKETNELVKDEKNKIDLQIDNLKPTTLIINAKEYIVEHKLVFTMVDGKICNSLTDTKSSLKCYLCNATSNEFNNLENILQRPIKEEFLSFGISVLHSWIRMFECILHVAYKLPLKKWRINKDSTNIINENKSRIQTEFRSKMSLIVDRPKPGYGNSNDGNVARKCFQNYDLTASITGVDKELIRKFYIILQAISSGYKLNLDKFRNLCLETAKLYISLYPWYPMTVTVHKILIHGSEIIRHALLPIGQLSEEAQEARNKDFKNYRENFSRKISREANLQDIFNRLLISSDPVITYTRALPIIKKKEFYPEVIDMLEEESLASDSDSE